MLSFKHQNKSLVKEASCVKWFVKHTMYRALIPFMIFYRKNWENTMVVWAVGENVLVFLRAMATAFFTRPTYWSNEKCTLKCNLEFFNNAYTYLSKCVNRHVQPSCWNLLCFSFCLMMHTQDGSWVPFMPPS